MTAQVEPNTPAPGSPPGDKNGVGGGTDDLKFSQADHDRKMSGMATAHKAELDDVNARLAKFKEKEAAEAEAARAKAAENATAEQLAVIQRADKAEAALATLQAANETRLKAVKKRNDERKAALPATALPMVSDPNPETESTRIDAWLAHEAARKTTDAANAADTGSPGAPAKTLSEAEEDDLQQRKVDAKMMGKDPDEVKQ